MNEIHLIASDKLVPRMAMSVREAAPSIGVSDKHFRDHILPDAPNFYANHRYAPASVWHAINVCKY